MPGGGQPEPGSWCSRHHQRQAGLSLSQNVCLMQMKVPAMTRRNIEGPPGALQGIQKRQRSAGAGRRGQAMSGRRAAFFIKC